MESFVSMGRRAFLAVLVVAASWVSVAPANAGQDAEAFAQRLIDQGVGILRNTSDPARRTKFRDFITQYADARKTALFTLGNYRRGANDAELEDFVKAFTAYATAVYESRLDQYKGQTLKVVGSIDNKANDVTVNMIVVDPNATNPLRVAFRLLGGNNAYRFVDIQVEGIWLSIDQREQFAAFLSKNNGNIPRLTAHLQTQSQQIMAGGQR
ncbi:MAG: ABC transporter substrate-binding protein [Alphaproteobacteria bacterium]|nr:ABC transporter substrate-binding protein [Alphaproteobacteria bacterium]